MGGKDVGTADLRLRTAKAGAVELTDEARVDGGLLFGCRLGRAAVIGDLGTLPGKDGLATLAGKADLNGLLVTAALHAVEAVVRAVLVEKRSSVSRSDPFLTATEERAEGRERLAPQNRAEKVKDVDGLVKENPAPLLPVALAIVGRHSQRRADREELTEATRLKCLTDKAGRGTVAIPQDDAVGLPHLLSEADKAIGLPGGGRHRLLAEDVELFGKAVANRHGVLIIRQADMNGVQPTPADHSPIAPKGTAAVLGRRGTRLPLIPITAGHKLDLRRFLSSSEMPGGKVATADDPDADRSFLFSACHDALLT